MKGMRPLVAAQLALSFAVVFAAVLLGRTLTHFARIDPGFNPDRLITAAIEPDTSGFSREQIPVLVDRLLPTSRQLRASCPRRSRRVRSCRTARIRAASPSKGRPAVSS